MAKRSQKKKTGGAEASIKVTTAGDDFKPGPSCLSREWLWGLILLVAIMVTYSPVWRAGYVWDDDMHLTANPCIVGPLGLKEIWTTSAADICPLTLTTFWLEHKLWGLAPLPFHLVNVLMHGAGAILLWRVLRVLHVHGAWLGAALWALHPVQVESVAWITEMKNTESGVFFLLSCLFFVKDLRTGSAKQRNGWNWNYALTLLFAALAMASKSSTVILPLVLCLCAWWVDGRWQWRNLIKVAPIFLMSIAASAASLWTVSVTGVDGDKQWIRTWPERLITAGDAIWFYLGKLLWPHPLMAIHPRWQIDAGAWYSYLPLLAVIVVWFVLWLKRKSWGSPWFFAAAYFLVALLPVLGFVEHFFMRFTFVAYHFQYLASMGPLALAGAGLVRLGESIVPRRRALQGFAGVGVLLVLGTVSWQRAAVYESDETLWTDTLGKNPDCWLGYHNLGSALFQKGQVDEAIQQYHIALKINPHIADPYNNLGTALLQKGQVDEAIQQFQIALKINPNYAQAWDNLGDALFQKGQVDEAIQQYQIALKNNPNDAQAFYNLGNALLQKGQVDEAIQQYQIALKIHPNDARAHNNLGLVLFQKGQADEAIAHYQRALEINPTYADAHNNLGSVLLQKGQVDEAIAQCKKAVEINPIYADGHYNLGLALAQKGQLDEAIAQYQKALEINPKNSGARNNLGAALAQKGQMKQAIIQFQEALRFEPNNSAAQANLAKAQVAEQRKTIIISR